MQKNKIKIVYLIDDFRQGGGTENQLYNLINNIDENRFSWHVFNLHPRPKEYAGTDPRVAWLGVERLVSWAGVKAAVRLIRFLRKTKVDILQAFFFDSRLFGVLTGRLASVRKMVVCRRDSGWWHTRTKLWALRASAKMADYCLVNSQAVKEMVVEAENFNPNKVTVIYNGVGEPSRASKSRDFRKELNIPDQAIVIGMIANLRRVKRIDLFLVAAARVKNTEARFFIVGKGPLEAELKAQARTLHLESKVHFFHTIKEIPSVLDAMNIGVLTSESEGLSNVLIEYGLSGLPAIAFDTGGNKEVIRDGKTGFIVPLFDFEQIADKLNLLIADHRLREEIGARAKSFARERFSISTMCRKTEEFYLRILENDKVHPIPGSRSGWATPSARKSGNGK